MSSVPLSMKGQGMNQTRAFTFNRRYGALTARTREAIYVPDQVIENQHRFNGERFPVMRTDGRRAQGVLKGHRYGLGTGRVGDPVVALD